MADPELVVRRAAMSDAAALAALRWTWRVSEHGEGGSSAEAFAVAFETWMAQHEASHTAFLAWSRRIPVGMAWLATVVRVPGPGTWERLAGTLQSLYVLPAHRQAGVGAALITAVIADAASAGLDYVSVHPSARSFSLYERAGLIRSSRVLELDLRPLR